MNNNVTIHKTDDSKKDYQEIKDLINEKYKKLNNNINETLDEILDDFNSKHKLLSKVDDKVDDLEVRLENLDDNVDGLVSEVENIHKKTVPIQFNIPSQSNKPFVSDDGDDTYNNDDSEETEGNENGFSGQSNDTGTNEDEIDSEDELSEANDEDDNYGSKAATKADMQKLANYIKEETEKSRPTLPKEAAIGVGVVGVGVLLRKYAMILGGRNDVFR